MHNADMFEVFERLRQKRESKIKDKIDMLLDSGVLEHELFLYVGYLAEMD